jgi:PAS domain S-box-containing protein
VRFSTPKRAIPFTDTIAPSVLPWRDALLSGLAVAMAVCLGAYIVYHRAWTEKVSGIREHVVELAQRVSQPTAGLCCKLPSHDPKALASGLGTLNFARSNSDESSRLYAFELDGSTQSIIDTGNLSESPGPRPLPPEAYRARRYFQQSHKPVETDSYVETKGLDTVAFAIIHSIKNERVGLLAVESNSEYLVAKVSKIRQALWLTCGFGLLVGCAVSGLVWRLRINAALSQIALEERHRVEEAIVSTLGEVVYSYDPESGLVHWRGNLEALLGAAPAAASESRDAWEGRIHPDDRPSYRAAFDRSIHNLLPLQIEYRVRRPDESVVWVMDRNRPVQLRDERMNFVGSLIDLTDRRTAEEAFHLFFDETPNAHFIFDGDSVVDVNPAAVALFGAENKAALIAQPAWALWPRRQPTHTLSAESWSIHVLRAIETSEAHFEWQFRRLDGGLIECDVFLRRTTFQDRTVLLMACYDVTPTRRAQAQLIESEQRFRDVSEAVGEFIWEMDREFRFLYASQRAIDVFGLDPEQMIGHTPFDFIPAEDHAALREQFESGFRSGRSIRNFIHRVRRADGKILWVRVTGVPKYDPTGNVIGFRGASLDVTLQREHEQELVLQKEAAESADRAKSNFLAMMSHEIRTPLNSVLGFADLVLDTSLTTLQREYLEIIRSSGDSLLVLLNDILDFSKIESGRMEVEIRPTDISRCVQEVIGLYQISATAKKLELSATIEPHVPRQVLTDWSRLRQILVNLVGNAVKFTNSGHIRIKVSECRQGSPRVRIIVSDSGIGIGAEQKKRLFQPFTQADSSTTRRFGGTGLGLAISKRLARLLGGNLDVVEQDEPGTSFCLEIPSAAVDTEEVEIPLPDESFSLDPLHRFAGRVPRVLVVDDNTLNRRLTAQLLHRLGAETDTAASASECFEKLASGDLPDLILMDVQMPGMDGLDATRHIRKHEEWRSLPIVALTADAMVGDRERCIEAGMNGYLTKPLRREALSQALTERLNRRIPN